jgi:hypothetical protein
MIGSEVGFELTGRSKMNKPTERPMGEPGELR